MIILSHLRYPKSHYVVRGTSSGQVLLYTDLKLRTKLALLCYFIADRRLAQLFFFWGGGGGMFEGNRNFTQINKLIGKKIAMS